MLYICATPIGNLQDITLRVLDALRQVDLVACEDTRHTRILMDRHGISARLVSFHEHNEEQRLAALLPLLREGKEVALVSDAGMPGLSDPGFSLVRACAAEGIPVTVLPGPSAISTALVASGLPADRFAFIGFLPRAKTKLADQLATFEGSGVALVAFESPRRLRASLEVIGARWPERRLAACRELTKLHEEVIRGTAAEILERLADPVRGEIVLVMEPFGAETMRGRGSAFTAVGDLEARVRRALADLLGLGVGTKRAAAIIAQLSGLPTRRAYELALDAKKAGSRPHGPASPDPDPPGSA
ncbi:MAG: 16S rRNA (cytidine(1402)-2'-O)-methyltransferase [bacterium]